MSITCIFSLSILATSIMFFRMTKPLKERIEKGEEDVTILEVKLGILYVIAFCSLFTFCILVSLIGIHC